MNNVYFVSGIDTDIGKSYATGYLAKKYCTEGISTITQKLIETGAQTHSADIALHRKIMGIPLQEVDTQELTAPELFSVPTSPHLAAQIDKRAIDFDKINRATATLSELYDRVLLEGAGGLMVPLTKDLLTIDFVAQRGYKMILVTSPRLGSLNHTLLSLEALQRRGIELDTLVYNTFNEYKKEVTLDTLNYLTDYLTEHHPRAQIITMRGISL